MVQLVIVTIIPSRNSKLFSISSNNSLIRDVFSNFIITALCNFAGILKENQDYEIFIRERSLGIIQNCCYFSSVPKQLFIMGANRS